MEETYWPDVQQSLKFGQHVVKTESLEKEGIHHVVTMVLNKVSDAFDTRLKFACPILTMCTTWVSKRPSERKDTCLCYI